VSHYRGAGVDTVFPLFWVKKEEIAERKAGRARKTKLPLHETGSAISLM